MITTATAGSAASSTTERPRPDSLLHLAGEQPSWKIESAIQEPPHPADAPRGEQRTISDDFAVRLSDTELQQMRSEIAQLLDRWTDTSRTLAGVEDGQERHAYYGVVMAALVQDISATTNGPRKEPNP